MSSQNDSGPGHDGHHDGSQTVEIQIDRIHYKEPAKPMTGAELRKIPSVPIPADRDLFLVVPGGADKKIGDHDQVDLRNGMRFFTAPGQINPGSR